MCSLTMGKNMAIGLWMSRNSVQSLVKVKLKKLFSSDWNGLFWSLWGDFINQRKLSNSISEFSFFCIYDWHLLFLHCFVFVQCFLICWVPAVCPGSVCHKVVVDREVRFGAKTRHNVELAMAPFFRSLRSSKANRTLIKSSVNVLEQVKQCHGTPKR